MSQKREARREFDKYDSHGAYHWKECDRSSKTFNPPLVARYQVVVEQAGDAARILEIGAGDGCLTGQLAKSGASVTGIEVEPTAVRLAVAALKDFDQCSIAQADCYRLPFSPKTFDLAVMADVIEHLEDPESALAEAALVLKPDGILLVTTPKWRADRVWDVHHVREYTPSEIYACLSAFFQSVDISYFWPLFWSRLYSTRIGWRLLRAYSRYFSNPFLKVGAEETLFGQILAVCRGPKSSWQCNAGAVISNNHVT